MEYSFEGVVERRNMGENARGTLFYNVFYLPERLLENRTKRYRIQGIINNSRDIKLGLQPDSRRGSHYIILSKALLKELDKRVGDEVRVDFDLEDPNHVDVPPLLVQGLRRSKTARKRWEELTAGKKRTWTTYVERAKRRETQETRVVEVLGRLKANQLDPKVRWEG